VISTCQTRLRYESATPALRWSALARRAAWEPVKLYPTGGYVFESLVGTGAPRLEDRGCIFEAHGIGQLNLFAEIAAE
jgi:hypothetical protein